MSSLGLRNALLGAITICGVGLLAAVPAQADTFNLTSNHCSVQADCGAPGTIFGTVALTQSGTTVDFTVHLNNPPYVYAVTGSADFMLFKFNATGVVLGDITVDQTVAGQTLVAAQAGVAPHAGEASFNGDGT